MILGSGERLGLRHWVVLLGMLCWSGCLVDFGGPEDTNVFDCTTNPCQNGGTCASWEDTFTCDCTPGFSGPFCSTNIDDCAPDPCQHGGLCTDAVDAFSCDCLPGYSGPECSTNVDDCAPNPCQNGGTCTDGINDFVCDCSVLWTGDTCEIETCVLGDITPVDCGSNASLVTSTFCSPWTDGNEGNWREMSCSAGDQAETSCVPSGTSGCSSLDGCVYQLWIGSDLGSLHTVSRLRFRSDWWLKRPDIYEVWVSDAPSLRPNDGATFVASGVGNVFPWACVDGESCIPETVPDACCPNGRDQPQDTVHVGPYYGKYDILGFDEAQGRYWYLLVNNTYFASAIGFSEITWVGTSCTD